MDFPHLGDTRYPNLNNVNVYSFKNTFDYSRWEPNTQVRLVNVLWNSDYSDVVKFESNIERDKWFDSIDDYYDLTLTSNARILPDGQIKLPIPFDVAARYNYLYIDFKYATSENNMIDYESTDGVLRWYFFVDSIEYAAPNTTVFHISIDAWTNYINDVDINYMVLERGHAPVAYTDVDTYLSNPIENNKYLLAPDITFGRGDICNNSTFIPFGNGEKYICFASTCKPSDISRLGSIVAGEDYTVGNITYSDVNVRYGYQLEVHGFGIGDGYDYSGVRTPVAIGASNGDRIANNTSVYAIKASECYGNGTFFSDILTTSPSFLYTLKGCFVVSEDMIELGTKYNLAGHDIYSVVGKDSTIADNLNLTKSDFNYPERYAEYAKLYTYPYAYIEITDNDGKSVEVKIEETSNVKCESIVSLAFPYVNSRIYFDGIGGTGYKSYSWVNLANINNDKEISNSEWFKYCFDWQIPCYGLYVDGETAYKLTNFNRAIKYARRSALVNYHNSARQANNVRANSIDLATTANTNDYANANTLIENMTRSTDTARDNMDLTIATNEDNFASSRHTQQIIVGLSNDVNEELRDKANSVSLSAQATFESRTTAFATNTKTSEVGGGIMQGMMTGMVSSSAIGAGVGALTGAELGAAAGPVGVLIGGGVGLAVGMVKACITDSNATATLNANQAQTSQQIGLNNTTTAQNNYKAQAITTENILDAKIQMDNNNDCMDIQQDNTNACNNANTGATAKTMKDCSDRNLSTNTNNANYTREVAILNAKEILENTRNTALAALYDSRNARPVELTGYSGNSAPDYYQTRGIQYKLKTMNESELIQTGDFFARFGYSLNQNWDIKSSGFNLMKHFTYWKATDVWVDDRKSSNNSVQLSIIKILIDGVTVWANPEEIGKVSIYDN